MTRTLLVALLLARARRQWREFVAAAVDCVCPPVCPACGAGSADLCPPCSRRLELRLAPVCPRCGAPVGLAGSPCPADHRAIQGLLVVRAPFAYRGAGGELVRRAKFQGDRAALRFLARGMADALAPWARGPGRRAVLVPVPLHRRKRRQRGIDQAALLAVAVGRRLCLDVATDGLRRHRDTLPQGDIRVTSRVANVAGAFAVRRRSLAGRLVVLVDDVRTSGSTARECARVLRAAGVSRVGLLTATQA